MTKPTQQHVRTAHPPSLIRVFAVRSVDSEEPKLTSCRQRRLWSDWADAQADLSLRWAHMPFCWFCHEAAQLVLLAWRTACYKTIEPQHDKTNEMTCAPSEDSDQPGHLPSMIRVFAVRMKKHWALSYPLSASEDSDQTGWMPKLIWVFTWRTGHFCWFCHAVAHLNMDTSTDTWGRKLMRVRFLRNADLRAKVSVYICKPSF